MKSINDFRPEAVVVDAGDFPTAPVPLGIVDECRRIVCCDGAADAFLASGRVPWRIVGDCDSISPNNRRRYNEILRRFPDQDTNDQTKAVRYLASKGFRTIAIVGATGKREDHSLGNISLLIEYMKRGLDVRIYTDYGVFIPVAGNESFHVEPRMQISIFNFGATELRAEGLRYPIRDFGNWWEGTLNEAVGDTFTIFADGRLLIFITYEVKQEIVL